MSVMANVDIMLDASMRKVVELADVLLSQHDAAGSGQVPFLRCFVDSFLLPDSVLFEVDSDLKHSSITLIH